MRCWAPHNSDTQKALSLGSSQPCGSLCGAKQPQGLLGKMPPLAFPPQWHLQPSPLCPEHQVLPFPAPGAPSWDHPASPHYSQPPVMPVHQLGTETQVQLLTVKYRPAPHCEVQASSHLGPHKRLPRGDCGSFRGTVSCLCCWVSSPALQPHPVLSCRDQGQGPHPGAQSVPTEGLILIHTEFKEDFCTGVGDLSGNRAAEVKK